MNKKHKGGPAPVPPGNRGKAAPQGSNLEGQDIDAGTESGASFQDQDPKRRLGGFSGAGEHPRQQPGGLNDGDRHSE